MISSILAATAHHEAGHAVAAIMRGVQVGYATIAAGKDSAGHLRLLGRVPKRMKAQHDRGMIALAGETAQRRFNPLSVRQHHVGSDREAVLEFALRASGSPRQAQCLVNLWQAQADDLIQARWETVERVAGALLGAQTLNGIELKRLAFMPVSPVASSSA